MSIVEGESEEHESSWPSEYKEVTTPLPGISVDQANSSSSTSSSIHGSEHLSAAESADNETDRSSSPDRSAEGDSDHSEEDEDEDSASVKFASQMAAAQQRQSQYTTTPQHFGTPNMARGPAVYPIAPNSSALSPRYPQQVQQRTLPRAQKLPVTGYELLATRLSHANSTETGEKIKPMYRKFEALNHRLLLHLQDEISELEERLHRLDHADTQSRQVSIDGAVVPASRRAAQAAGGELQWHKTDVLGRIGFKLAQYSKHLHGSLL